MKNIWFISKYASPPRYSKAPSRLFHLANEFSRFGSNVTLITSDSNHFSNFPKSSRIFNEEKIEGVNLIWIKTLKYTKTASFRRILSWIDFEIKLFLLRIINKPKPDVIIVSSLSILSIIYGIYIKKRYKSFLVFEIRDIWPLTMTEEGGFSRYNPLVYIIGLVEKFGYRNSDLIVGTMPKLNNHVMNRIGYEKPFFCSPLGFNPDQYITNSIKVNNPFHYLLDNKKTIIGYAGSMGITNALEPFIDAIKKMYLNTNLNFILVGSGDLKKKYEDELKNYNNVTFIPRISQDDVKYFLEICDILYLSTKDSKVWEYGQSMNKIVEYMIAGKPIIASYTGYQSMINEAGCGIFISSVNSDDIKDALLLYSSKSKEELNEIGKNGKKWIYNNRTYEKLAKEYICKINSLIKK
jgi:glycosyltransferase involved in cell wall biosynthesis